MLDEQTYETVLLVSGEALSGMPEVLKINLHPIKRYADGSIRNFSTSIRREPLADFKITGQLDRNGDIYGWRAEYHDVYSVGLTDAETMLKLLRKVDRGMEKLRAEWGYPQTFRDYVAQVGKIIGVKGYGYRVDDGRTGWSYDENTYQWTDVEGMGYRVGRLQADHQKTTA
jgi:hypothetical protein